MRGLRVMLSRSSRVDHERLLDAARATRSPRPAPGPGDPLASLLRAAAAPARERELAGEEAAVAAFRAAHLTEATDAVTRRRRHRLTVGALAWVAGVAATATAGAALAAVGLDRSGPTPPPAVTSPAAPEPTIGPGTPTGEPSAVPTAPTDGPTAGATSVPPTSPPGASLTPSPEATDHVGPGNSDNTTDRPGLCRAYLAKSERQREKALDRPAFNELVVAAGGAEHVEGYCRNLRSESDPDSTTGAD
ncbi:hypothetical protein ACFFMR_21165 [Micromonospora andamanensis]|uniref:Uncharacterized protein n=1 Tax=Micromonospora andamanensis TaxID=1287068 RepID=A0ABQ4HUY2_9ACTN|nr:hypothetical protein [Micromonospora andamanensis]GIJ09451.1 hypothetical protein Van01_26650 [Micromonospora andamanensis]